MATKLPEPVTFLAAAEECPVCGADRVSMTGDLVVRLTFECGLIVLYNPQLSTWLRINQCGKI